jgi:PucR C-terminal helix-turn-helix domain/GGDEF-like domain
MAASPPAVAGTRSPTQRVGEALLKDTDRVGRAMVDRILEEVPHYTRAPQTMLDDVMALAARNAVVLCTALATATRPTRGDLDYVAEHVRRRVHQGVPLESLIHAYRVGNAAFWVYCIEEAVTQGLSRDGALALAKTAFDVADAFTTHAAETYVREEARIRTHSRDSTRDLLEILLSGDVDAVAQEPHVAAPGLDPHDDMIVAICSLDQTTATASTDAFEAAVAAVTVRLTTTHPRPLVAVRQSEIVAVVAGQRAADIIDQMRGARADLLVQDLDLRSGISLSFAGFSGVRDGYRHAGVALAHTVPSDPVIALGALPAFECALLTANATTRSIIAAKAESIRALERPAQETVLQTIAAFAEANMNITRASHTLHVHPNTLRYRLGRIHGLTGHDPRTFHGLMELTCVLGTVGQD